MTDPPPTDPLTSAAVKTEDMGLSAISLASRYPGFWIDQPRNAYHRVARVVSKERVEAIAREHGIRFMETSAKANINIERAFSELAEAILDKTAGRDADADHALIAVERRPSRAPPASRACCS